VTTPAPGGALGRRLAIAASVVVLATIVASVVVTGTPAVQREAKLDARRVRDLGLVEAAIDRHFKLEGALPASLAMLADKPGVRLAIVDPVTGKPYDFEPIGARTYRLCATFTTDTAVTPPAAGYWSENEKWAHGTGRLCFNRVADAKE